MKTTSFRLLPHLLCALLFTAPFWAGAQNVGIGIPVPLRQLHVANTLRISGSEGLVDFHPVFKSYNNTVLVAAIDGLTNGPQIRFESTAPGFIDLGLNGAGSLVIEGDDVPVVTATTAGNVGIGTEIPHSSALLDLSSNSRGLLLPRMTDAERNAVVNPATGLLVFVTSDSSFYYRQGQSWKKITGEGDNWSLNGNSKSSGKFIGTLDSAAFRIRTKNKERLVIDSTGYIGVNNPKPSTGIHLVDDGRLNMDFTSEYNNNSFGGRGAVVFKRSRGTYASPLPVAKFDWVGSIINYAYNNIYYTASEITTVTEGDFSTAAERKASLRFYTPNGTNTAIRMMIGGNGNVGIGTSKTNFPLSVKAVAGFGDLLSFQRANDSTDRWHLKLAGDDSTDLNFVESGVEENRFYLAAGGNVGIGTSKPLERLQVGDFDQYANAYLSLKTPGSNQYKAGIKLRHGSDQVGYDIESDDQVNTFFIKHWVGTATPSPILSVSAAENVGIGLATPELKLDVQGGFGIRSGAAWDHMQFSHDGATAHINAGGAEAGLAIGVGNQSVGSYTNGGYTEVMRLMPNGNVGVGTNSPNNSALLHLASTTKGLLIPQMTSANRDAISSPATGLLIFQTNNNPGFYYQTGSGWTRLATTANSTVKIITGYVDANQNQGTGYTLTRLANNQYKVTWPAGTFSGTSIPDVRGFSGSVAFLSWTASSDGSGTFTTVTNAGTTIWFTITELK